MVLKKFRPLRQWGRFNTLIFRTQLRARNLRKMPAFDLDRQLAARGVPVYDPRKPEFFATIAGEQNKAPKLPPHLEKKPKEKHPLYKAEACFLFDGTIPMLDGCDEACALAKATRAQPLPEQIFRALPNDFLPADFEQQVQDAIMAGEHYDPTLERLPKKFDPIIFWVYQLPHHGTPVRKRNNIILANLYHRVAMLSMRHSGRQLEDARCDVDEAVSAHLPTGDSGVGAPLVFRHQPHIVIQSERPTGALAGAETVQKTSEEPVPDVYPISPLVDLEHTHIYNATPILPRLSISHLHLNTVLWGREQDQKYPWTTEQNIASTLCHCFGAALAQASRPPKLEFSGDPADKVLRQPVVAKAVQLVDGKMDFAVVQLNTLNLGNRRGIKNLAWMEKAAPLYKPKPMHENMTEVEALNVETARKFAAMLLFR